MPRKTCRATGKRDAVISRQIEMLMKELIHLLANPTIAAINRRRVNAAIVNVNSELGDGNDNHTLNLGVRVAW